MAQRDGRPEFEPDFHWPHAAEACKAYLDLDALEPMAVRVLARGLLSQRLVAFVGAGLSAAYGRQTWAGLMEALWKQACDAYGDEATGRGWPQIRRRLWPGDLPDFLRFSDHAIKAQILADMLQLLPARREGVIQAADLKAQTQHLLQDFHGFVEWVCERWAGLETQADSRKRGLVLEQRALEAAPPPVTGLAGVLDVIADPGTRSLRERLVRVLAHQGVGLDSPLRLLIDEWGVRRFITTNYDQEIERGLRAMGFERLDPVQGPSRPGHFASIDFGPDSAGRALRFALDGPRRHAEVLHLHGDVADARSLIVTESDYQRLYLDDHPRRDLVTSATLANFGANPMLFVGSDISEDDVLRPMRQFMSGEGHRSDRMAVALFVSAHPAHYRAQRQVQLWLRYGVYALDVGRAKRDGRELQWPGKGNTTGEPWLVGLLQLQRGWREASAARRRVWTRALERLGIPDEIEGVPLEAHQHERCADVLGRLVAQLREGDHAPRTMALLDITVSWLSSLFVCAKLIGLRHRAREVIEEDASLARAYEPPQPGRRNVTTRHAVMLDHPVFGGRFARIEPGAGDYDENIKALAASLQEHPGFCGPNRRRVVLVCAARGAGKGGQFDRLIECVERDDGSVVWPHLTEIMAVLNGYQAVRGQPLPKTARVAHINLSFSNELGPVIEQVIGVMESMLSPRPLDRKDQSPDQLERLGRALRRLCEPEPGRLLIVLGNAGVLYDADGLPKNGQIRRVMRALLSPRFAKARLDILMYVGESQMPERQRIPPGAVLPPPDPDALAGARTDQRHHRRLFRLNIEAQRRRSEAVHVHPLRRSRVLELARAYFAELLRDVEAALQAPGSRPVRGESDPAESSPADALTRRLYYATGGSRLAHTLLLAWMEAALRLKEPGAFVQRADPGMLVDMACSGLRAAPAASAVEACVEFVLDQWSAWHQRHCSLPLPPCEVPPALREPWRRMATQLSPAAWTLQAEILWHLSAFSHPVEVGVLMGCRRVADAAHRLSAGPEEQCVLAALELLVHRCLVFRIVERPFAAPPFDGPPETPVLGAYHRVRYTLHRHIQRHFLRLMGGRNLELTSWDPYTTTLYASLPDEAPVLPAAAHLNLVQVLKDLTDYPNERPLDITTEDTAAAAPTRATCLRVQRADRIRAAYYLARSTYSLGVLSHLSAEAAKDPGRMGHLEQYRRLVRWITHAARYWEKQPAMAASPGRHGGAIFHPGELIWLYNECGVISLAQGKLHDAEQALGMAEAAVRRIEYDDTGSLHTRICLHSALVQIERGRPQRARQILQPIAERRGGHPVPPLLACFYLGQIDHLGGSYRAAIGRYELALEELRRVGRSRAAAFVLMNLADVRHSLHKQVAGGAPAPAEVQAWVEAEEAISLAQQGGHEDLRVMATLGRVRLCIDAGRLDGQSLFEHIEFAQRYAVLMDQPRVACDAHELRARLLMRQGEYRLSATDATQSLEIAAKYDLKLKKARGLLTLAEILLSRGETDSARTLVAMGREIAVSADYYACVRGFKDLELRLHGDRRRPD